MRTASPGDSIHAKDSPTDHVALAPALPVTPLATRREAVVWRLVDGKPGHEKQSDGLLQALADLWPIAVFDFDMRFKAMLWRQLHRHRRGTTADIARPDLLVGVGHRTHVPMLLSRALCGGASVVLMKPTLPARLFDLVLIPRHDRYRRKGNMVETRGVVCPSAQPVRQDRQARAPDGRKGLILLGGLNRHYTWSSADVGRQVAAIAEASPDHAWRVCDSRRTPDDLRDHLPTAANLSWHPWQTTSSDFLGEALRAADSIWVTADSASMLYESLSMNAHVGVIALTARRGSRFNKHARGIALLLAQGHVHSSRDGFQLHGRMQPPHFFPENRRCAQIIVDRFFRQSVAVRS